MKNSILSAVFFLIFLGGSALTILPLMPNVGNVSSGKPFEKDLVDTTPFYKTVRNLWGRMEWVLFHQGRVGAIFGADGWFYLNEELLCERDEVSAFEKNIQAIEKLKKSIQAHFLIVVIPSKARIRGMLPVCKEQNYRLIKERFDGARWRWIDGYALFQRRKDKDKLFLRADTHWTPHGASIMAKVVALTLKPLVHKNKISRVAYYTRESGMEMHEGDLGHYFPGTEDIFQEDIKVRKTIMRNHHSIGLINDYYPDISLVGTSYSYRSLWNFEGVLKQELQADIFNASQQGKKPIRIMQEYLESDAYKLHPPKIIIWEIPERFFFIEDDYSL